MIFHFIGIWAWGLASSVWINKENYQFLGYMFMFVSLYYFIRFILDIFDSFLMSCIRKSD